MVVVVHLVREGLLLVLGVPLPAPHQQLPGVWDCNIPQDRRQQAGQDIKEQVDWGMRRDPPRPLRQWAAVRMTPKSRSEAPHWSGGSGEERRHLVDLDGPTGGVDGV